MLEMQLPVFMLLGLGSVFAGVCFFRLRKKMPFVGAGMLSLGFLLWGLYLGSYPLSQQDEHLYSAGFFVAAVLQLFIAVSMIVLVLEEVRYKNEQVLAEIAAVRSEKEALQVKVSPPRNNAAPFMIKCASPRDCKKLMKNCAGPSRWWCSRNAFALWARWPAAWPTTSTTPCLPCRLFGTVAEYAAGFAGSFPALPANHQPGGRRHRPNRRPHAGVLSPPLRHGAIDRGNVNQTIEEVIELTRPRWRDLSQREGISIQIQHELEPKLPAAVERFQ